jgi:tetratricopeptide (TPR) repeat protein
MASEQERNEEARRFLYTALFHYKKAKEKLPDIPRMDAKYFEYKKRPVLLSFFEDDIKSAVDHLLNARALSPGIEIQDGTHALDCDELTARLLLIEAIAYLHREFLVSPVLPKSEMEHGISVLEKYLTYKPDDANAHIFLAKAYVRIDCDPEALKILSEIVERFPTNSEARVLITLITTGDHYNKMAWEKEHADPTSQTSREFYLWHARGNAWFEPYGGKIP